MLAVLLTRIFGLWGIPVASIIAFSLNNLIILPVYTARITKQKTYTYYKGLFKPLIYNASTCFFGLALVKLFGCNSIILFLVECIILTLIYFAVVIVLMNKKQKELLFSKAKEYYNILTKRG